MISLRYCDVGEVLFLLEVHRRNPLKSEKNDNCILAKIGCHDIGEDLFLLEVHRGNHLKSEKCSTNLPVCNRQIRFGLISSHWCHFHCLQTILYKFRTLSFLNEGALLKDHVA